ncbi:MAG TPA: hypothetical protein VJX23_07755 [Candidatus Binataceae bacterium]|nr:hypothetical protein [Candidatus Binataceae bacterium]
MRRLVILSIAAIWALFIACPVDAAGLSNAAIQGSYKCKLTGYTLPATGNEAFAQTSSGDIELVSDGAGKWTSGVWDDRIDSSDIHASCKFQLSSGAYSVNADGTGTITVGWKLNIGASTPNCMQFSSSRDEPSSDQLIITDGTGAKFYTAALNPFAVLASICER